MNETMNGDMEKTVIGAMDNADKTQMVSQPQDNATQYAANVDCPVCHTPNPPSERYCIDCGFLLSETPVAISDMPEQVSFAKLVMSDGTREFTLNTGENSVGRENADVLLTHNSVSRRHAKITVAEGHALVEDLGSTNGTYVDGQRLANAEKVELKDGCEVLFGSVGLKFQAPEQAEEVSEEQPAELTQEISTVETSDEEVTAAAPEEEIIEEPVKASAGKLVSKDGSYTFDLFNGTNTIGRRDGSNDIVIPDPYCSGRHADLLVEDGKFTLTDVGSTNGTMVNGVKLDANAPRELQPGDELTIGRIVFGIEVA